MKGSGSLKPLLRCLRYLLPYKFFAIAGFLSLAISSGGNLVIPRVTQMVIDRGITGRSIRIIIIGAIIIVGIAAARAIFTFLQGYLAARLSQGVAFDLRNTLYKQIQHLSFSFHDRAQTGQLLTRATSDVDLVRVFIGMGVIQLFSALIMMIGAFVLLFRINWRLTLMIIPVMGVTVVIFRYFARRGRPLFRVVQQKLAALNTRLQENITGVRVVKAFNREPFEVNRFGGGNNELLEIGMKVRRIFAIGMPLIFSMSNLSTLIIIWAGGYQVLGNYLSIGELVAFQAYLMMSLFPIMMLGMLAMSVAQAAAGAERIFEILDVKSEVQEKENARDLPAIQGRIEFDDVGFRYFQHGDPVLTSVSFVAEPGQTIALLGATGSGKSTVINLIPRFYDVTEGRILIDGHDVRDLKIESLRQQIGIVLQESVLFGGTVRENIAYGKPDAKDDEIIEAAKTAEAHEFISAFPDGYDTAVGERGVTLSGGQKQRVAIARALLIDPRILIFDDSTSSVDFATETKIQRALERLREGRLCFVIAQRISTVKNANKILVLDKGRIAGMGDHAELLRDNPIYADIYYSQLQPEDGSPARSGSEDGGPERAGPGGHPPGARGDAGGMHGRGPGKGGMPAGMRRGDRSGRPHGPGRGEEAPK
jgi:ATP-binding cassette subfamily B protein